MAIRHVEDLIAFQFAAEFKGAVYDLIEASPRAQRSFKFRAQLEDSASGIERAIGEGFGRRRPAEFAQFLRYGLASLVEAAVCLRDGISRKYFVEADCETAFTWERRCRVALDNLLASQQRRAQAQKWKAPRAPPLKATRRNAR